MKKLSLGILLATAATQAALAQNINFLHRGPVAYLNDADKQILTETLKAALNDAPDGETLAWSNPDSGNNGTIEVLDTHEDYETTCRTIRTNMQASGREGGGVYRLCRAEDDTWQFAPRRREPPG